MSSSEATLGQTPKDCTCYHSEGKGRIKTQYVLGKRPKESLNGKPLGAGLQTIYTTVHEGCARLSIGLCTVHDIIVELGARLLTSRVAVCTAQGTGLGYCRARCTDKMLHTTR